MEVTAIFTRQIGLLTFLLFICAVVADCDTPVRVDEAESEHMAEYGIQVEREHSSDVYSPLHTEQPTAHDDESGKDITRLSLNEMILKGKILYGGVAQSISVDALTSYFPDIPIINDLIGCSLETAAIWMRPPEGEIREGVVMNIDITAANIRRLSFRYIDCADGMAFTADVSLAGMNAVGSGYYRHHLSDEPYRYVLCYKENDSVFMLTERRGEFYYSFMTSIVSDAEDASAFLEQVEVQAFIDTINAWMTQ